MQDHHMALVSEDGMHIVSEGDLYEAFVIVDFKKMFSSIRGKFK